MLTEENLKSVNRKLSSQRIGKTSSNLPKFIIVLNDGDFIEERGFFGSLESEANLLQRKIMRKMGPVLMLSLKDASSSYWKDRLNPRPKVHMIYAKHPFHEYFIYYKLFHELLLSQKRDDLLYILTNLGAKSVVWNEMKSLSRYNETPGNIEPEQIDNVAIRLPIPPQWEAEINDRLQHWSSKAYFDFIYEDDFAVNDKIINKMLKIMNAKEIDDEIQMNSGLVNRLVKKSRDTEDNSVFKPCRDGVRVLFFSRPEYTSANIHLIERTWTGDHVEAFLKTIEMKQLIAPFREENVQGCGLRALLQNDKLEIATKYGLTISQVDFVHTCIKILGNVEHMDIMTLVLEEYRLMKLTVDEKVHNVDEMNLPYEWHILNSISGIDVVDGDFDVLVIGRRSVGKTSLIKTFQFKVSIST